MRRYTYIDVSDICKQCNKVFFYTTKAYKKTGIVIKRKTVCNSCILQNDKIRMAERYKKKQIKKYERLRKRKLKYLELNGRLIGKARNLKQSYYK